MLTVTFLSVLVLLLNAFAIADTLKEECEIDSQGKETCLSITEHAHPPPCLDLDPDCEDKANKYLCRHDFTSMRKKCPKSCHMCDNIVEAKDGSILVENIYSEQPQKASSQQSEATRKRSQEVDSYMYNTVYVNKTLEEVRHDCLNRNERCLSWAAAGECENNPNFMELSCAPACFSCHKLLFAARCPFDKNEPGAWKEGDLDKMFTRLTTNDEFQQYTPQIHSSPHKDDSPEGPWVVTLENFLSEEECETMIKLGTKQGYKRSADTGEKKFDGTKFVYGSKRSKDRTSSTAWCNSDCSEHDTTKAILDRMETVTGIPSINYEALQLLQYEQGQFYGTHHDYIR